MGGAGICTISRWPSVIGRKASGSTGGVLSGKAARRRHPQVQRLRLCRARRRDELLETQRLEVTDGFARDADAVADGRCQRSKLRLLTARLQLEEAGREQIGREAESQQRSQRSSAALEAAAEADELVQGFQRPAGRQAERQLCKPAARSPAATSTRPTRPSIGSPAHRLP